ncbi:hypothetical protein HDE_06090 [Halotydeus destructor]|nr:hypothetical protein HDE_06090 [Halotydeus destructor]
MARKLNFKDLVLKVSNRPFKPLQDAMIRGGLIPASYVDIKNRTMTSKQYLKVDIMTMSLTILMLRHCIILATVDKACHRILGYLFSSMGSQGKVLIFTTSLYALAAILVKIVTRQHAKDNTLDHLFDMIPLVDGGQDADIARQMNLTLPSLKAFKVRVKVIDMAVRFSALNFPIAFGTVFGIGLFIAISHETEIPYIANHVFWYVAWVYLVRVMVHNSVVCFFCWYLATQLIKFRLGQINEALSAIRDDKSAVDVLGAVLDEQKQVIRKVHRYNIPIKTYIFILIFLCSPLLGSSLLVTVYLELEMKLMKVGLVLMTASTVVLLWFISSKTADIYVEAKKSEPILYAILATKASQLNIKMTIKMAAALESVTSKQSPVAFSCGNLFPWLPMSFYDSTSKPVKEVHSEGNKILKSVLAFLKSLEMKAESEATARSSPVILEDLKTCMKDIIAEEIGKLQLAQPTPSYAAVTQTRAETSHRNAAVSVPKHIVRVRTKNKDWSTRELRDTLKENIELTEQVRIEQMRCGSDAVTIACDSLPAKEALITAIRSKADSLLLEVEDKQLVTATANRNAVPNFQAVRLAPIIMIHEAVQIELLSNVRIA